MSIDFRPRAAPSAAPLDLARLGAACAAATELIGTISDDQEAIDQALQCLWERVGPDLLVSVYALQLDRLWLVAQRGYDQVRDGFGLGQGVMARAVRTSEQQVVTDSASDQDFIAATTALRSEIAIPLSKTIPAAGVFNVETRASLLGDEHVEPLLAVAAAIAPRLTRTLDPQADGLASMARLFVYASSLRTVSATAELAVRSVGRLLHADSVQLNFGAGRRRRTLPIRLDPRIVFHPTCGKTQKPPFSAAS